MTLPPIPELRPDLWTALVAQVEQAMFPAPTMDVRQVALANGIRARTLAVLREVSSVQGPAHLGEPADDLAMLQTHLAMAMVRTRALLEHAPPNRREAVLQLLQHELQALIFLATLTG